MSPRSKRYRQKDKMTRFGKGGRNTRERGNRVLVETPKLHLQWMSLS